MAYVVIAAQNFLGRLLFCLFLMYCLSGCNSSSESSSSHKPTSYRVGVTPLADPQNVYPYLQSQDGVCIDTSTASCTGNGGSGVTQLKAGPGFIGFPFALQDSNSTTLSLGSAVLNSVATYSGPTATYSAKHYPVAVEHGAYTYFVFSGPAMLDNSDLVLSTDKGGKVSTGELFRRPDDAKSNALAIYVARLNHKTGKVSAPLLIHVKHSDDPHDNAVLNFDSKGDLYILISGRSLSRSALLYLIEQPGQTLVFNSNNLTLRNISPENIDYSTLPGQQISVPDFASITYPKLLKVEDGFRLIYSLYCTKGLNASCNNTRQLWTAKLVYNPALSDIAVLQAPRAIAAIDGHYVLATSSEDGRDIALAFNLLMDSDAANRTNLYFLYSNDSGETWRYIDSFTGARLSAEELLPINSRSRLAKVAAVTFHQYGDKVSNRVYLKDLLITGSGAQLTPLVAFVHSVGLDSHTPTLANIHRLELASLSNGRWKTTTLSGEIDHNYSTGFLNKRDEESWRMYFPATPENNNNGLAGGAPAYVDLARPDEVNYLSTLKDVNNSNYLDKLCEINYLRPVLHQHFAGFVGFGSASNPYQFDPDSANKHLPASPLYIIDNEAHLYRLPMLIAEQDENEEMPIQLVDSGELLACDSAAR
jgi:hypothetical protein